MKAATQREKQRNKKTNYHLYVQPIHLERESIERKRHFFCKILQGGSCRLPPGKDHSSISIYLYYYYYYYPYSIFIFIFYLYTFLFPNPNCLLLLLLLLYRSSTCVLWLFENNMWGFIDCDLRLNWRISLGFWPRVETVWTHRYCSEISLCFC